MSLSRALIPSFVILFVSLVTGCTADSRMGMESYPNPITGEGLVNPNPTVIGSWATLPDGREWGSTAGIDIDRTAGHVWAYERCGSRTAGGPGINCENNPVDPIFKFDRNTGEILANFGAGVFVTPHGIHADRGGEGNVWVTHFAGNAEGTKGHQVHKFSPTGELRLSLGTAGQPGSSPNHLNQPNDVIVLEWGEIGTDHGQFRTPHALAFDNQGRLWVQDRRNHRLEIFEQEGNYLASRYLYGRISDLFITSDDMVYAIDSESNAIRQINWRNGVRIGRVDRDWFAGFISPWESANPARTQGVAGEGVAVDGEGNVYVAEGPAHRSVTRVRPSPSTRWADRIG